MTNFIETDETNLVHGSKPKFCVGRPYFHTKLNFLQ